jgi:hypothetical protein
MNYNLEKKFFEKRVINKHPKLKECETFNVNDNEKLFLMLDICECELDIYEISYLNKLIKTLPKYISLQPKRYLPKESNKKQIIFFLTADNKETENEISQVTIKLTSNGMTFNDINGQLNKINYIINKRLFMDFEDFIVDKKIEYLDEISVHQALNKIFEKTARCGSPLSIKEASGDKTKAVITYYNKTNDLESLVILSPSKIYRLNDGGLAFNSGYFLVPDANKRIYIYETNEILYEEKEYE